MFSTVILTLNEARSLPACLASVSACDDVVVLDSGSTDGTAAIAKAAGARVIVNRFEDFAQQRNFAHERIPFRHEWIFHLDADEQFTPALFDECSRLGAQNPGGLDGFFVAPRMLFRGRWIRHSTDFPAYQARFAHARRFRFVQTGHGQREAPGLRLGHLSENYLHDLSTQSEAELWEKHRRYARAEAAAFLQRPRQKSWLVTRLCARDALVRRRALKEFSQHLPARGPLRFFYQYVIRRGFLDGTAGFAYCRLLSSYEHWISQEIRRQKTAARGR